MGTCQSKIFCQRRNPKRTAQPPSRTLDEDPSREATLGVTNANSNENRHEGIGDIINYNPAFTYIDRRPLPILMSYESAMSISAALPPKPIIFHGRGTLIESTTKLLTNPSTAGHVAILGSGGMGKTTVAVALLYESRIIEHFGVNNRVFLSCEGLADGDTMVIALAKMLSLPASADLLAAVIARLTDIPRVLLVLDNLETVWLVGGAPESSVDELLGKIAQVPSLSLIITCRGSMLPQHVRWSNTDVAKLEPLSLEAALESFQDRAQRRLIGEDKNIAKQLLDQVDRMPLAVSILGQLLQLGNSVSELLVRWNREHSNLLQIHGIGRINSVQVSIELSIKMLCAADKSGESLQLLSLCCLLPDGLHPDVFEGMRALFTHIDRARDVLSAYALATISSDRVLVTLSPIRHVILKCHSAQPKYRDALNAIYFGIADRLPIKMDDHFKGLAACAAPEMGNLASILLNVVCQPSQKVVDAVIRFTESADLQLPTVTIASALLPYLEPYTRWKADCLKAIGLSHISLGNHELAVDATTTAARLYLELGELALAARCKCRAGLAYYLLGELKLAELSLSEALAVHVDLGNELDEAVCRSTFGAVLRMNDDYPAAIQHLNVALRTFNSVGDSLRSAQCIQTLGTVYRDQQKFGSAAAELEAALSIFMGLGDRGRVAETALLLADVRRQEGNMDLAEQRLEEAQALYSMSGDWKGRAECAESFGHLRRNQQRRDEAFAQFTSASSLYEMLQMSSKAQVCRNLAGMLEPAVRDTVQ